MPDDDDPKDDTLLEEGLDPMPDDNDPKDDVVLGGRLDAPLDEDEREDEIPKTKIVNKAITVASKTFLQQQSLF